jgi:putative peptidoglycan lipid II flippase
LIKILAPGFYAKQDIRTPVKIGLIVLVFTQLMNVIFVPKFAHAGLALSIGLGACLNASLLWIGLSRRGAMLSHSNQGWGPFFIRLLIALLALGIVLHFGANYHDWIELGKTPLRRILYMMAWTSGGMMVYFVALRMCGFNFRELLKHSH